MVIKKVTSWDYLVSQLGCLLVVTTSNKLTSLMYLIRFRTWNSLELPREFPSEFHCTLLSLGEISLEPCNNSTSLTVTLGHTERGLGAAAGAGVEELFVGVPR